TRSICTAVIAPSSACAWAFWRSDSRRRSKTSRSLFEHVERLQLSRWERNVQKHGDRRRDVAHVDSAEILTLAHIRRGQEEARLQLGMHWRVSVDPAKRYRPRNRPGQRGADIEVRFHIDPECGRGRSTHCRDLFAVQNLRDPVIGIGGEYAQ